MTDLFSTQPDASRSRSYNGGYMEAGKLAEGIVLNWLNARPWVIGTEDLRSLRVMREADVDCSISLSDGRITLAEIKSDRHLGRSGNYVFECLRINHTAPPQSAVTLGWSARSPARLLLLYAPSVNQIHVVSMDDFRTATQAYTREARQRSRVNYVPTDVIKSTVNILVPAKYVQNSESFRVYELEVVS